MVRRGHPRSGRVRRVLSTVHGPFSANGQRPSESEASGSTRSCHQVTRSKADTSDLSSGRPRRRLIQLWLLPTW